MKCDKLEAVIYVCSRTEVLRFQRIIAITMWAESRYGCSILSAREIDLMSEAFVQHRFVLLIASLFVVGLLSSADPASAMGAAALAQSKLIENVHKIHGFHCREELGWEPRSGLFRRHSHKGICDDYKRCLQVHHRCIFVNGRGIEGWKYERWGNDNWRYTSCMLERGCY